MREAADLVAVLDGEPDLPAPAGPRGARDAHQQVAQDRAQRVAGAAAERRRHEVEARVGQAQERVSAAVVRLAVAQRSIQARIWRTPRGG